jgi:hypothetical protein
MAAKKHPHIKNKLREMREEGSEKKGKKQDGLHQEKPGSQCQM